MAKKKRPAKKPKRPDRSKPVPPPVPPPPPPPGAVALSSPGDDERERKAGQSRDRAKSVREIGPLPRIVDPARREKGRKSLRAFLTQYFPRRFRLSFSSAHLIAIDRMEACTDSGELFACAMPRGFGKTTMAECAVLRAVLYGFRRFVVLVCATGRLAERRLKQIMRELETNDLLLADFPEACYPIRSLNRIHNRAKGQTLNGKPTRMEMTKEGVVLPTVPGSACSGAILQVAGMEGAIRGLNVSGPDGEPLRPDLAVIDDAQTRDSAKSLIQTSERESVVTGDVLGLAGPDVNMAAVMLCTVIYPNDLSERFLSEELHPEWQGVRTKLLEQFPADMELWDQYAEHRRASFRAGDKGKSATAFYRKNRKEMDAGAVISWPDRKKPGDLSGLQSAMNWFYTSRKAFMAEGQNAPEVDGGPAGAKELIPAEVAKRVSGCDRYAVPPDATRVTAMIDAGGGRGRGLWYMVCAWTEGFGGSVLDYGAWPRQSRTMFSADDMRPGMAEMYPTLGVAERLYKGLTDLSAEVLGREYIQERTGGRMRVERCLVDSGWQPQTVYAWCRQTPHWGVMMPSKGIARTSTSRGVAEWKPRPGEPRPGYHWRITMSETGMGRMVQFDPDAWKSFIWERFTAPLGGSGCLTVCGRAGTGAPAHEMLGEHLAAENAEPMTVRGSTFDKWTERPHRPDNHWLDCLVGCAVGASVQGATFDSGAASGVRLPELAPAEPVQSFSQMQREARAARNGGRR